MEGNRRILSGLAAIGAAFAVAGVSSRGSWRRRDHRLHRAINTARGPVADAVFRTITEWGSLWAAAAASAVLARTGRRREAASALGAASAMWAVGQGLKKFLARPRPYRALERTRLMIAEPSGTSWPSSHPAVLLSLVTVAGRELQGGAGERAGLAALAGLVGVSRIYLGVHYPSDVIGGLLLGRGVADLWSGLVGPRRLTAPSLEAPATVSD